MTKVRPASRGRGQPKIRCAIYTRKSSEEGLEQDFNSLDAQREACEAYVTSQRHEGWGVLPAMYDDGGFSGGTIERPALQRLLAAVAAGGIDVVVVYKVDRLTRSLADFAKIVEIFDQKQVSFVSVTQAFNTTSSMGRLTLNVLLSFAQFEREVTGERIRDKIAASKRKGLWMGGQPPLGYDVRDRKLIVNAAEADTVRHIFRRYCALKSVRLLKAELDADGIVSKARTAADGSPYGARPLARGALYLMLANRIYRGEIVHKGQAYPGEHPVIVDAALWAAVQQILTDNRVERNTGVSAGEASLLAGLVFDAAGERLTPSHTVKRGTRYRYYVSRSLIAGSARGQAKAQDRAMPQGQRIPAASLENLIKRRIRDLLASPREVLDAAQLIDQDAAEQRRLIDSAGRYAGAWSELDPDALRRFLRAIVARIQVHADRVEVTIDDAGLMRWLAGDRESSRASTDQVTQHGTDIAPGIEIAKRDTVADPCHATTLIIPARLKRTGVEMRLVVEGDQDGREVDAGLTRLMVRAHMIRDRLLQEDGLSIDELATQESLSASYVTRLMRLTFLAPDIVTGVLTGRHPPELTAAKLMADTRLPLDWTEQRTRLGFA